MNHTKDLQNKQKTKQTKKKAPSNAERRKRIGVIVP